MGRMAELAYEREQIEQEIAIARMEAEHDAIPNSMAESLEHNRALRTQLGSLVARFEEINSPRARNRERGVGFLLGVAASLASALLWWAVAIYVALK